jgi:hypothetical protein
MRRVATSLLLLTALALTTSGIGQACPAMEEERAPLAGPQAATSEPHAEAPSASPPCHRSTAATPAAPAATRGQAASHPSPAQGSIAPHPPRKSGNGCCDPASGTTCPHACHFLALTRGEPALAALASVAPLVEAAPAASPAPLPGGVDHIPLA